MSFSRAKHLLCLTLFIAAGLAMPSAAIAADVADYTVRLTSARSILGEMIRELVNHSGMTALSGFDAEKVTRLRALVPAGETVETPEGPVEVSNAWLHSRLDDYITRETAEARAAILLEIDERLASIIAKVGNAGSVADGITKDEQKAKLREILAREQFQKPSDEQESWLAALVNRVLEWLRNLFPQMTLPQPGPPQAGAIPWLQYAIIAILAVFVGFVLYRLSPLFLPAFRRNKADEKRDRVILGEKIGREESAATLFSEAEALARAGDIRAAIRKGYIALLCEFSDRRLIGLARHKTNRDYLRDMRDTPVYRDAESLTGKFETHWYGSAPTAEDDWEAFRKQYQEALARI
jgi:hypothetical protein